jgi:pyruvate formate lyase activating enzyme
MSNRGLEAGTGLASYQSPLEGGGVRCELCPHRCSLSEGGTGLCKVRRNEGGRLVLPYWGVISSLALDPIEKKPLHHFKPGTAVFSAGFYGCNLRCPFCQNWEISQEVEAAKVLPPDALVEAALESGAPSLAFTYSEPTVHLEYLLEAARLARQAGLATVLVTNGCINEAPARELLPLIDAANVDLKSWSEAVYREKLGGDRAAVLRFIELAAQTCELEVTTLVVPGVSEGEDDMEEIASFLAMIDRRIPLHLSAYHPDYRYREPPSEPELLLRLAERARRSLDYVYLGNLGGIPADTYCSVCGALLVRRLGYRVDASGLASPGAGKEALSFARCRACGSETSIRL